MILFLPSALGISSFLSGMTFDVSLNGYTEDIEKPTFSLANFFGGEFQSQYSGWYQENFQPRGIFVRNYATILYNLFHTSTSPSRIVGRDGDIFESVYIDAELCINGSSDFSEEQPQAKANMYIEKLEMLKDKLAQYGKSLYVVMTPSKADFHRNNIPEKFILMSDPNAIPGQDYLAKLLNESDIPHTICFERKDDFLYPPFYLTGIHWSRTFEL